MKKKLFALGAAIVMAMTTLTGCGSSNSNTLTIGMEIGYPPFEYYDTDGTTPTGIDVEIGTEIAERLGMEAKFVDTAWDGIFAGLKKGDYDIIISACTITADRLLEFEFSTPYIENHQCIVTRKDAEFKPSSIEELEGHTTCYQDETSSDIYLTDYCDANNISIDAYGYAQVINCFDELSFGRVETVFCDSTVATIYCSSADSEFEITWMQDSDPEEFGVVIPKGNTELKEKIDSALEDMKADGTLDAILAKYF